MKMFIWAKGLKKIVGFMFNTNPKSCPLMFDFEKEKPRKKCLHSWFCFFTIKTSFYDSDWCLVKEAFLRPWETMGCDEAFRYVLEEPIIEAGV